MIRVEDKSKFEYLLNRGLVPSTMDAEGCNGIHYAVRMGKLDFLSYLLEGDYSSHENGLDPTHFQFNLTNISMNKSYLQGT
jgi:ankyrin repeat protein